MVIQERCASKFLILWNGEEWNLDGKRVRTHCYIYVGTTNGFCRQWYPSSRYIKAKLSRISKDFSLSWWKGALKRKQLEIVPKLEPFGNVNKLKITTGTITTVCQKKRHFGLGRKNFMLLSRDPLKKEIKKFISGKQRLMPDNICRGYSNEKSSVTFMPV